MTYKPTATSPPPVGTSSKALRSFTFLPGYTVDGGGLIGDSTKPWGQCQAFCDANDCDAWVVDRTDPNNKGCYLHKADGSVWRKDANFDIRYDPTAMQPTTFAPPPSTSQGPITSVPTTSPPDPSVGPITSVLTTSSPDPSAGARTTMPPVPPTTTAPYDDVSVNVVVDSTESTGVDGTPVPGVDGEGLPWGLEGSDPIIADGGVPVTPGVDDGYMLIPLVTDAPPETTAPPSTLAPVFQMITDAPPTPDTLFGLSRPTFYVLCALIIAAAIALLVWFIRRKPKNATATTNTATDPYADLDDLDFGAMGSGGSSTTARTR